METYASNTSVKIGFAGLLLLWLLSFYPIYPGMIDIWINDPESSHCILVPLISLYFIWQKRDALKASKRSSSYLGLIILSASMLLHILSYAGSVAFVSRTMIVTSLIGLIIYYYGFAIFKTIAFPLLFLFFMIPIPVSFMKLITFPMQLFATDVSEYLIRLLSIPVFREGNILNFAETSLEVAEACSGIRSMHSFLMLGFLFAYLMRTGWTRRIILVVSAIPLALLANVSRITLTAFVGHYYDFDIAKGFLHDLSGMTIFVLGLILFLIEFNILDKKE